MAGIGFELRKLVETRTLRGILGAAFSGTLVVAGPWLISAASLAAAERLLFSQSGGMPLAFTGAMVWALAISICASAAPLYIFVRLSADLICIGISFLSFKGKAEPMFILTISAVLSPILTLC